jgi:vacuolar-type H+-ATPase subunit H
MHEVIQKIIAAETEAKRMVQAAKADAGRVLAEAQTSALELKSAAQQKAQKESEEILKESLVKGTKEKKSRLATVAREIERQIVLDGAASQKAAAAVVKSVCG